MLLRLPPELVTLVLEHLWTEEDWTHEDAKAQGDLARCCRVSKALCALAQPILWRHVYLKFRFDKATQARALNAEPVKLELAAYARTVAIARAPTTPIAISLASRFGSASRISVTLVNAPEEEDIDLQDFSSVHNLYSLYLPSSVVRVARALLLRSLVVLELADVTLDPPGLLSSLTPVQLPSLRALLLLDGGGRNPSLFSPALLAQLDCVQAEVTSTYEPPADNRTPTLFLVNDENLGAFPAYLGWSAERAAKVRHLCGFDLGTPYDSYLEYFVDMFSQIPNLKTLWLPMSLESCGRETSPSPIESLLALCQEKSVSVHWDRDYRDYAASRTFWEYAKGLKTKGEV
ncbi:hypothetical protein JCM10450v2_002750 [Rhodotorula kratochvilovae]